MKDFLDNLGFILGIAVVGAFILVGGWLIGAANAHSNRIEHERHFACIDRGGHWEYLSNYGLVCKK